MLDLSRILKRKRRADEKGKAKIGKWSKSFTKKTEVILVGDVGSGKESTVKELAIDSFMGRFKRQSVSPKNLSADGGCIYGRGPKSGGVGERGK